LQRNGTIRKFRILNVIDVFSRFAFPPLVDISLAGSETITEHFFEVFKKGGQLAMRKIKYNIISKKEVSPTF